MKELAVQLSAFGGGKRESGGEKWGVWGWQEGGQSQVGGFFFLLFFFSLSSPFPAMFASFGRNSHFAFLYSALDLEMFPFSLDRSA